MNEITKKLLCILNKYAEKVKRKGDNPILHLDSADSVRYTEGIGSI